MEAGMELKYLNKNLSSLCEASFLPMVTFLIYITGIN